MTDDIKRKAQDVLGQCEASRINGERIEISEYTIEDFVRVVLAVCEWRGHIEHQKEMGLYTHVEAMSMLDACLRGEGPNG